MVGHPQLFVTLTAPSFGPVHRGDVSDERPPLCRPRRGLQVCPHGELLSCIAAPWGRGPCGRRAALSRVLRLPRGSVVERPRVSPVGPERASSLSRDRPGGRAQHHGAALGGPPLLPQSRRVPGPRARPPPRRAPSRRRSRAERAPATLARRGPAHQGHRLVVAEVGVPVANSRVRHCAEPVGGTNTMSGCSWPVTKRMPEPSRPTWPSTPPRRRMGRRGWRIGSVPGPRSNTWHFAPTRDHGEDGLGTRRPGAISTPCTCAITPTPSATAGSSRPRASASPPPSPHCARPGRTTSSATFLGRERPLRLRRRVALCRTGLWPPRGRHPGRHPARGPARGHAQGPREFPTGFPERFPSAMTRENVAEEILGGISIPGTIPGTFSGTLCGAMVP